MDPSSRTIIATELVLGHTAWVSEDDAQIALYSAQSSLDTVGYLTPNTCGASALAKGDAAFRKGVAAVRLAVSASNPLQTRFV